MVTFIFYSKILCRDPRSMCTLLLPGICSVETDRDTILIQTAILKTEQQCVEGVADEAVEGEDLVARVEVEELVEVVVQI